MTVHSKFSPSGSSRWLKCPGSIQLIDSLNIKEETSHYAEEGTAAHELLEACLKTNRDPAFYLGENIYKDFVVDREMANAIQQCLDYIRKYEDHTTKEVLAEQWYSLAFLEEHMGGTCDVTIINEGEIHIMDLKYGKGIAVDVENNTQLMLYAMGAIAEHQLHKFPTFHLHILQPRAIHQDGPFRHIEYPMDRLREFAREVRTRIANACSENPDFEAGETQCRWCPAAPICKTHTEFNLRLAHTEFEELVQNEKVDPPTANTISVEMISLILQNSKTIENWLNGVKAYAVEQMMSGEHIPHYKLVYGRTNRAWKNDPEVVAAQLHEKFGLTHDDMHNTKIKTPAQIDQLLTKDQKEEAEEFWEKPRGSITLAPNTSNKPAINKEMAAMADFEDL